MKQKIAIKLASGLVLPETRMDEQVGYSLSFIANMMAYGFMPDAKLADALSELGRDDITSLSKDVMPVLKELVGAHVIHKPFYPNFPAQVMDADDEELFTNAQTHYLATGQWLPNFTINKRPVSFENVKFKSLGLTEESDISAVVTKILQSADSISGFNKEVVEWAVNSGRTFDMPTIPFKENICLLAGLLLENDMWSSTLVKDTTDILRIVTFLNDGDISLSENTKFKSLPRKIRKVLVRDLERVAREEDFVRHSNKWIKLLHNLHVGDYSQKLYDIAKKLRENKKIETFNGKVEAAFDVADIPACISMLKTRPGIFARRIIDLIYKDVNDHSGIVNAFAEVVNDVPARNLTQLLGAVKSRDKVLDKRVVFPKGMVQSAYVLRNEVARLVPKVRTALIQVITDSLEKRFSEREPLGNVYIDPALYECPLPTAMRSASEGLKEVARGTRMPIGDKNVLRFFIYWKGDDIDLSATFHDEDFNQVGHVSYTNLKASGYKAVHSGDITSAPRGASEFIDINIQSVLDYNENYRYVAMNVLVYSGPPFSAHDECFAGWMTRRGVDTNEIFEPKTVAQKIDLRSATKNVIPVIFDLKERKAIWTDISTNGKRFDTSCSADKWGKSGNNVENNKATIQDMVEAFTSLDNKITLGELFAMHATVRGTVVADREDADFVFAMDEEANITPYDIIDINADYL